MWKRKGIRIKLLILCLGCTLTGLCFQMLLFQSTSAQIIYNQAKDENYRSLQYMQADIRTFLKGMENNLIDIYNKRSFITDLKNIEKEQTLREQYYRLAYDQVTENFDTSSGVVAMYIYDKKHQIISTYRRAVTPKHNYPVDIYQVDYDMNAERVKEYFDSDQTELFISSYYNPYRQTRIVRLVLKIYNYINIDSKIGYIVCDIDSKVVRKIVEKYRVDQNMVIWLQPFGDIPVYVEQPENLQDQQEIQLITEQIKNRNMKDDQKQYKDKVFFSVEQDTYNLTAYSLVPSTILYQTLNVLTKNLVLITVLMLGVISASIYFVSRIISRPIEEMTRTVKRIRQGETQLRMEGMKEDEVGELGKSFNLMLDQIEDLIKNEYEYKMQVNKSMYQALQAQINPHFLYNTLDTMGSIAEIQECFEVSTMCESLAGIFRYSLDTKNLLATVSQELIYLKRYIFIMNTRMNGQIQFQIEADDCVLKDTLPRISIQPLVENAITHGVKNKKGEKIICITVCAEQEFMVVTVADNGIGMSEEKISQFYTDTLCQERESRTSIGLTNIHRRMQLLYGEAYSIQIQSRHEQGTSIQIRIPRKRKEAEPLWEQ